MLSPSIELGTIKKKRKKQIYEYDPLRINEENNLQIKKVKIKLK